MRRSFAGQDDEEQSQQSLLPGCQLKIPLIKNIAYNNHLILDVSFHHLMSLTACTAEGGWCAVSRARWGVM